MLGTGATDSLVAPAGKLIITDTAQQHSLTAVAAPLVPAEAAAVDLEAVMAVSVADAEPLSVGPDHEQQEAVLVFHDARSSEADASSSCALQDLQDTCTCRGSDSTSSSNVESLAADRAADEAHTLQDAERPDAGAKTATPASKPASDRGQSTAEQADSDSHSARSGEGRPVSPSPSDEKQQPATAGAAESGLLLQAGSVHSPVLSAAASPSAAIGDSCCGTRVYGTTKTVAATTTTSVVVFAPLSQQQQQHHHHQQEEEEHDVIQPRDAGGLPGASGGSALPLPLLLPPRPAVDQLPAPQQQQTGIAAPMPGPRKPSLWQKMYRRGGRGSRTPSECGSSFPPTPRLADAMDGFGQLPLEAAVASSSTGDGLAAQLAAAERSVRDGGSEASKSGGSGFGAGGQQQLGGRGGSSRIPAKTTPSKHRSITNRLLGALRGSGRRQEVLEHETGAAATTTQPLTPLADTGTVLGVTPASNGVRCDTWSNSGRRRSGAPSVDADASYLPASTDALSSSPAAATLALAAAQQVPLGAAAAPGAPAAAGSGGAGSGHSLLSTMNTDHTHSSSAAAAGASPSQRGGHATSSNAAAAAAATATGGDCLLGSGGGASSTAAGGGGASGVWQTQYLMSCALEDGAAAPRRSGLAGRWRKNLDASDAGAVFEELLDMPKLQRLARQRTNGLEIRETDGELELLWRVRLNGAREIVKSEAYPKDGGIVEIARRDGREGLQRGFVACRDGVVNIRSVQGDPHPALLHDRLRLSTRGNRLKIEHKLQLLIHGVQPVRYVTIWSRVPEEGGSGDGGGGGGGSGGSGSGGPGASTLGVAGSSSSSSVAGGVHHDMATGAAGGKAA